MRRSVLCVLVVLLLCLAFIPRPAQAQLTGMKIDDVKLIRTNYPTISPFEGSVSIYGGVWDLRVYVHNYDITDWARNTKVRFFLNEALFYDHLDSYGPWKGRSEDYTHSLPVLGAGGHSIRIEVWYQDETTPQDTYSFAITVVKPEVSNLQANSKVVRAVGDNTLTVSFTNDGTEHMRQAVLSMVSPNGLTITPNEVELGDVRIGESTTANFRVSSPAEVRLGTINVGFSVSFIDYAGVSHTEDISGEVEVYRIGSTLTVSTPNSIEKNKTVTITATLTDAFGNPIANENVTFTARGTTIGTSKTNSNGIASYGYMVAEVGTLDVGASFAGSASYESSSAAAEFEVIPASTVDLPVLLAALIVLLVVGSIGVAMYLSQRSPKDKKARE